MSVGWLSKFSDDNYRPSKRSTVDFRPSITARNADDKDAMQSSLGRSQRGHTREDVPMTDQTDYEQCEVSTCLLTSFLMEAMAKDIEDRNSEPDVNLKAYLTDAYLHPIFHSFEEVEVTEVRVDKNQTQIPSTSEDRPQNHVPSPSANELSSPSPLHHAHNYKNQPPHTAIHQYRLDQQNYPVNHYGVGQQQPYGVFHYGAESPSNSSR